MERAIDLLVEASLHGVMAALAVELLIRRLPVRDLPARTRARLAVLAFPLLTVPLCTWLAPWRAEDTFADIALLSSRRWEALTVAGWPLRTLVFAGFAGLGVTLWARDVMRDVGHLLQAPHRAPLRPAAGSRPGWLEATQAELDRLAARRGLAPVPVYACLETGPVLACRGLRSPYLLVSEALVTRLGPDRLGAALAHELSHVAHRDAWQDLWLALLRGLQCFNPVAQVLARRIVQEREWRADDEAVALVGRGTVLARALIESARGGGHFLGLWGRARMAALETRCRRLLAPLPDLPGWRHGELATVMTLLAVLACFVR